MFKRCTAATALVVATVLSLAWMSSAPATAVSLTDQTAADRVELERALEQYEAAEAEAAAVDARMAELTAALDRSVAEEQRCQVALRSRVVAMYRADDHGPLSLLLTAESVQDLADRLELLDRLAQRDADTIRALKQAREEATGSAEALLELQAEHARALEALESRVAEARADLAESESALQEYEAKMAAAASAAATKRSSAAQNDPNQVLTGSGEWQVGVASHYSRNFTGRGASGEAIGPYSMIVAHKTLPFGTLIEFEYKGKRAVARVVDRGPYTPGRDFDLGPGVVRVLDFSGVHEVRYRIISQ